MKPLPILLHMPRHIKQKIVDKVHPISRFALRQCSREFRDLVDRSHFELTEVSLELANGKLSLSVFSWDPEVKEYVSISNWYTFHPSGCKITRKNKTVMVEEQCHIDVGVTEAEAVLNNPRISIDTLTFETTPGQLHVEIFVECVLRMFSRLDQQLHVKFYRIDAILELDQLVRFLSAVHPGASLMITVDQDVEDFDELTQMEQWTQSGSLNLSAGHYPIDKMAHFQMISLWNCTLNLEDVKILLQGALNLGDEFDAIGITGAYYTDKEAVLEYLTSVSYKPPTRRRFFIRIPKSTTKYLEVSVGMEQFNIDSIVKMKEEEEK